MRPKDYILAKAFYIIAEALTPYQSLSELRRGRAGPLHVSRHGKWESKGIIKTYIELSMSKDLLGK